MAAAVPQRWHVRHLRGATPVELCGDVEGKRIVVTGPTSGIGTETAAALAAAGAHVVLACRSRARGEALCNRLLAAGGSAEVGILDLSDLASVRAFADAELARHAPLHALVNNAGIFSMGAPRAETVDGHEAHLGTNYYAPVLLTLLLLPALRRASPDARVVCVSSKLHELGAVDMDDLHQTRCGPSGFSSLAAYAQSKLAEVLFCRELARRLGRDAGVKVLSLHPGNVMTDVVRTLPRWLQALYRIIMSRLLLSPAEGCRSTVYCTSRPEAVEGDLGMGGYFDSGCRPCPAHITVEDAAVSEALWDDTLRVLGLPRDVV